ncbi:MAG TPA: DUF4199 domain-containing protein [Thermoanaerobaculia bacterium]|nr:DUF4199 domain-containing protein [Thermoanaerobaculia bacterium]
MKKFVLTYGLLSGLIVAIGSAIHLVMMDDKDHLDLSGGQVVGYTVMVVAFIAVFFGIRAYRDQHQGGAITFGRAFKVGILTALVTCAMYIIGWQILYYGFMPDFGEKYTAASIAKMQSEGKTAAEIATAKAEMAKFWEMYQNPLVNIAITFIEIFPVALIMVLISAGILRRKEPAGEGVQQLARS